MLTEEMFADQFLDRYELDAFASILQRLELKVDTGWALELDVQAWLCSMDSDAERLAAPLGLTLNLCESPPEGRRVPLAVPWPGEDSQRYLATVGPV